MNFEALGLDESIVNGLKIQGIDAPTNIQEQSISKIIENKNLIIQSETGSGKTLAYLLPMYAARHGIEPRVMQVIILVPTHELAMQVHRQVEMLSKNSGSSLKSIVVIGDVNINTQIERLREKPEIIIGTTGRIIELIKRKKIIAHTIKTIIIDEADKMLDFNNIENVKIINKATMRDTQIVMLSASISEKTLKTAREIADDVEFIKAEQTLMIPNNIKHWFIVVDERDKIDTFRKLSFILKPKRAIAFINNTDKIDIATEKLKYHKMSAECIKGGNEKENRKNVLADFSSGKLQFLIATDVAARGLHIEAVEAVFSISISEDPTDYLHRSGRTGRGNKAGLSISIVTKREIKLITKYQNTFGIKMVEIKMQNGEIIEICKR